MAASIKKVFKVGLFVTKTVEPEVVRIRSTRHNPVAEIPVVEADPAPTPAPASVDTRKKKKSCNQRKGKKGGYKDKVLKAKVEEKKEEKRHFATEALDRLGQPWDTISFVEKKKFGLHYYYSFIQSNPKYWSHSAGLQYAADMVQVTPRTILAWVTEFEGLGEMKHDSRGHHSKLKSPMDDPDFRANLHEFVKVTS